MVNGYNNSITGNQANNRVIFSGNAYEYRVTKQDNGSVIVEDRVIDRDGKNQLQDIEQLVFTDTVIAI